MDDDSPQFQPTSLSHQRLAHAALALVAVCAVGGFVFFPHYRTLVGYGLYAIPAHLLISLLPNEPGLLYVAKSYPPALVASVGTASGVVAGILDYWLIGWFVSQGLVRSKLDNSGIYRFAQRVFSKAAFVLIAACALLPVPFYPVKILAIATGYSFGLFLLAAMIGRWPRFYLLSIGGRTFQAPNSWLLGAAVVLEVVAIAGILRMRRSSRAARAEQDRERM